MLGKNCPRTHLELEYPGTPAAAVGAAPRVDSAVGSLSSSRENTLFSWRSAAGFLTMPFDLSTTAPAGGSGAVSLSDGPRPAVQGPFFVPPC